jgi:hypothetical protein
VATRLAAARLRETGISLIPLLKNARLTLDQIDNKDLRIPVVGQIRFLALAAKALQDPLLGFRLACTCDLREMRLLHYAAGAAATLGDAIHRFERYSSIVNQGMVVKCSEIRGLTIELSYAGVTRHSDQQQIEFLATTIIHSCRALTGSDLKPVGIHLTHRSRGVMNSRDTSAALYSLVQRLTGSISIGKRAHWLSSVPTRI